jgi:hypothetical protein
MIGLLWKYGLCAALLAGLFALHLDDKRRGINAAVELVRAEYITVALAASETARSREQELVEINTKVQDDLQLQKSRSHAAAAVTDSRVRDLQAALVGATARAESADAAAAKRVDDPRSEIIGRCGQAIAELDKYAAGVADQARGLQQYIGRVCLAPAAENKE